MYQANLSYKLLQRYLFEVASAQLIRFEDTRQRYSLTDKGREFLTAYEKYSKTNKYMEIRLNEVAAKRKALEELCPGEEF